jgi:DNA-binding transcriptional MerR regulator
MIGVVNIDNLIKIREVSLKYDISARALKYYEDMGLLKSTKSKDYAYRVYDENAIRRL